MTFCVKVNDTQIWSLSGNYPSWYSVALNLDAYAGNSSVTIKFEFTSDGSVVPSGDAGAWLDDIALNAYTYDLAGYDCYVPETMTWGQNFSLQGQVRNLCTGTVTTDFTQKFYLSNDQTWGDADDVFLGAYSHTDDVPASGYGPDFNVLLSLPGSPPSGYNLTGTLYIGMQTDANNNVREMDEANNGPGVYSQGWDWDSFIIPVTYDLTAYDCYAPDTIGWGQSFNLQIAVVNYGNTAVTTDFTQGIHLSNDTVWGDADDYDLGSYLHTADVPAGGLGPDINLTRTLPSIAPSGYIGTGPFYVLMYTDLNGNVSETNETNNIPPSHGPGVGLRQLHDPAHL